MDPKVLKQLQELKSVAEQLQYAIPPNWLSEPMEHAEQIKDSLQLWKKELKEIKNDLSSLTLIFRNNLNEITNTNDGLNLAKKAMRTINDISQKFADEQRGVHELEKKHLITLKEKNLAQIELFDMAKKMGGLTDNELESIDNQLDNMKILNSYIEDRLEFENKINEQLGLSGVLTETLQKTMWRLGGSRLSDYLGIDDAMNKTKEAAKTRLMDPDQFGKWGGQTINKFKSLGTLVKNLGKNLMKSIGPAAILAGIIVNLVEAFKQQDEQTGAIAQNLGLSYKESIGLTQELNDIATNTGDIWVTSKGINESFLTLSEALGTNVMLSSEMLVNFTKLTKQIGLSVEAATTLSKLSIITNKESDKLTKEYLGQLKLLNIRNDLSLNEKSILEDISNVSSGLLVTFAKQPNELAKSAFEAKKLGLELKVVEGLASSLLDIESSIANEFEAEVLTGRALNLERARYYALTNDIAGLAQEINNQGITSVEFSKMNRIQQDAIAKSLGMSRDEMGKMLMEQEAIRNVGAKNLEDLKEKLRVAQAQGKEEEFMQSIGNEQYQNLLKSQSVSNRFNQTMEKLKDIFVSLVDPLMPVLDLFVDIMGIVGKITKLLDPIFKSVGVLTSAISGLFTWDDTQFNKSLDRLDESITNSWGGRSQEERKKLYEERKINDGVIDSKGEIKVSTPKGTIQLNNNDTFLGNKNGIVAGTELLKNNNNDGQITKLNNSLSSKLDTLVSEIKIMSSKLDKGMTVNLDGNKVSKELVTPLMMSIRNT